MYPDKAPRTVDNFLQYVEAGHYDGTIVHRAEPSFLVQAGGVRADLTQKPTRAPVADEAKNGLLHERGAVAMARYGPHSATSHFYIMAGPAPHLDAPGYTVFGEVIRGLDVVDRIAQAPTEQKPGYPHLPKPPIVIERITVDKRPR